MGTVQHQLSGDVSRYVCELLHVYRSRPTPEGRLASYIIGTTPGTHLRGAFYAGAILAGCIVLVSCATLIIRAYKRCLWLMRGLKKSNGTYFSPHVGSTFALASVFGALGVELIILYEVKFWEGSVLPNPILVQTLVWYPLWTGGFCVVWGAAIATLGISQNQKSNEHQAQGRIVSFLHLPLLGNTIMIFIPIAVTATIFTTFIIANVHSQKFQQSMYDIFQQIGKLPSTTTCTPDGQLTIIPNANLQLLLLLQKSSDISLNFKSLMRLGFGFWAVANVINLVIWAPCFLWQLQILKAQIAREKAFRYQKQQLRSISHPMSNPDFRTDISQYYSDQTSGGGQPGKNQYTASHSDTISSSTHSSSGMVDMSTAYRALLMNSFLFALMTVAFLCLCIWFVVDPDVVLHGGKRRIYFLTSLISFFVVTGIIVNTGILRQAITAPASNSSTVVSRDTSSGPSQARFQESRPKIFKGAIITSRGEVFGQAI